MLTHSKSSSAWWLEQSSETLASSSPYATITKPATTIYYPTSSLYKAELLINGHLKKHWNTAWSKAVAVNQIILGLFIFILGFLMIFFQLAFSSSGQGLWTGATIFFAGFCAFFTIIYRHHRYFLFAAMVHLIAGLFSTLMIFISVFTLALEVTDPASIHVRPVDRRLNKAFHITLIVLGLYEKVLCYTFLILIVRHTHKMV